MSYTLTLHNYIDDPERMNGVQEFPNVRETLKGMKQDLSHGKANISLVKGLSFSGSGVLPEAFFCHSV